METLHRQVNGALVSKVSSSKTTWCRKVLPRLGSNKCLKTTIWDGLAVFWALHYRPLQYRTKWQTVLCLHSSSLLVHKGNHNLRPTLHGRFKVNNCHLVMRMFHIIQCTPTCLLSNFSRRRVDSTAQGARSMRGIPKDQA